MFYTDEDLRSEELFLKLTKTSEAQPEKGWVPAYYFDICLPDGTRAGKCDLRVGHNDNTCIGGNIGYEVDEKHRGHHYAAKACELLFSLARKHGMGYVIISCAPENGASARTCELAGAHFVETAPIPETNDMYRCGKRLENIYRFDL